MGTSGATEAIIQITTVGNYRTVSGIVRRIREYELPFPYVVWVVVEPGVENHYEGADEVIEVPEDFDCRASYKARAQEYSRRVRQSRGLDRHDVKVIMLDDDSLPTRRYLVDVFGADYDICEGILAPRNNYGRFLSHVDDLRTLACLTECAFWQGCGHPMWVHGEGLTLRGSAESIVTWNFPVKASEDLTVGHNAVERGLTFGFVYSVIEVTSPWTWRDFSTQRRRWVWGNIHALRAGLLPPLSAARVAMRWLIGLLVQLLVTIALISTPFHHWNYPHPFRGLLVLSLVSFFATFALACWVGSKTATASLWVRLLNTGVGTFLAPVSSLVTSYVLLASLARGAPQGFDVIEKERPE